MGIHPYDFHKLHPATASLSVQKEIEFKKEQKKREEKERKAAEKKQK